MCQSLAEGGKRCFSHSTHAPAKEWKKKIQEAKARDASPDELKALKIEYLTTEEGIETLISSARIELAEKFIARRNKLIDTYNAQLGGNKKHYVPLSHRPQRIWNADGTHTLTGSLFDPEGYDKAGFDVEGYNEAGYDKAGFDVEGYNSAGYDREGYNRSGYNRWGIDRAGFDVSGWNQRGTVHRDTGTAYDPSGLDINGQQCGQFGGNNV